MVSQQTSRIQVRPDGTILPQEYCVTTGNGPVCTTDAHAIQIIQDVQTAQMRFQQVREEQRQAEKLPAVLLFGQTYWPHLVAIVVALVWCLIMRSRGHIDMTYFWYRKDHTGQTQVACESMSGGPVDASE